MSIKMSPKNSTQGNLSSEEVKRILSGAQTYRQVTPEEAKEILTYSVGDAIRDDLQNVLSNLSEEVIKESPRVYDQCEEEIAEYHRNSCIILDMENIESCKKIVDVLESKGGEIIRSIESNINEFWIWIGAAFSQEVQFDNISLFAEWASKYELTVHTGADNTNSLLIGFMVKIGKYVKVIGEDN